MQTGDKQLAEIHKDVNHPQIVEHLTNRGYLTCGVAWSCFFRKKIVLSRTIFFIAVIWQMYNVLLEYCGFPQVLL